ncbi:IS110 family transposase [Nocardia higoensis]|uniref:IS110 family transposase n=1 Tax=Nocardia higoensis TaxID=228599 RepID=A0ABS0D4F9_9NOCA|nr:IS110 family transposase [Nocardia higoensis]MBF6353370.1 IS110 family transposase [Nocardia higoensis]
MVVIGVDPHKSTHTATAVDPASNADLGSVRVEATMAEYRRLIAWARPWPQRTWAVENADGLGRHLARWLIARGETALDVPTTATARVRELSRGGRRKNDRIDAAAAACVVALQGEERPVVPDERRTNLSTNRTRSVDQLHALLRELLAGGAPTSLTANTAAAVLHRFRARTLSDRVRVGLYKDLIADVRRLDRQLSINQKDLDELLDEHGTRLRTIDGIGPVLAARLIGRTGPATRFPSAAAFANYNGTAPVEIASADRRIHRLSRYGDRQLNAAIHTIAMVQVRMNGTAGRAYYDRKVTAGSSHRAAMRCLTRHLSNIIWRTMTADATRCRRDTESCSTT